MAKTAQTVSFAAKTGVLDSDTTLATLIELTGAQPGFQLFNQHRERGIKHLESIRIECADKTSAISQEIQTVIDNPC